MNIEQVIQTIEDAAGKTCKPVANLPGCYTGLCPGHNDHKESLFIFETEEGSVGFKCHAGCSYHQICDALGVDTTDFKKTRELTEEEKQQRKKRREEEERQREFSKQAMEKAWSEATPSDHKYLQTKKIKPFGTRVYKDRLLVPIYTIGGSLISFQAISEDGDKLNAKGCRTNGFYKLTEGTPDSRVILAEGFATAATIQEAFPDDCVICTFGLSAIKVTYHELSKLETREIIVAGDIGSEYGDLNVIYPDSDKKGYDFNDLYIDQGIDKVKDALKRRSYRARTLEEVLDNPPPAINWIFENFLHTNSLNIVYARHGEGKTRFVYELAFHAACGIQFLDYPCHGPRSVLIVDGEMSRSEFFQYIKNIAQRVKDSEGNVFSVKKSFDSIFQEDIEQDGLDYINLHDTSCLKTLQREIEKYDMVILDNLLALTTDSGTEHFGKRDREIKEMIRWLGKLKRAGKTTILIAHANKRGEIYGSNTMLSADAQSMIKVEATENGGFKIFFEKHRRVMPEHKKPFKMEYSEYGKYIGGWNKSIIEPLQKTKQSLW